MGNLVQRDLSKEIITEWYIGLELGYKPLGCLIISFDDTGIPTPHNRGGIYPPIKEILNFNEVLDYLNTNFIHLKRK